MARIWGFYFTVSVKKDYPDPILKKRAFTVVFCTPYTEKFIFFGVSDILVSPTRETATSPHGTPPQRRKKSPWGVGCDTM
jgi:hypothetical protein